MNKNRKIMLTVIPMLVAISAIGMLAAVQDDQKTVHMALIDLNVNDLAKQSDVIVVGVVESTEEPIIKRSEVFDQVFITYNVKVIQELTGNYQEKIIPVTVLGDERIYTSSNGVNLKVGEKVLLFLTHTNEETVFGDAYVPIGGYQSKFLIDDENFADNKKHGKIFLNDLISEIILTR
jgi:hypothetical protein